MVIEPWFYRQHIPISKQLFGSLGFLVENLFGLTTITGLFSVISSFTLSEQRSFTSFVLGNFVLGVFTTFFTFTVGLSSFGTLTITKEDC